MTKSYIDFLIAISVALIPGLIALFLAPIIIEHHKDELRGKLLAFFIVLFSIVLSFYYTLYLGLITFVICSIFFVKHFVSKDNHLVVFVVLILFLILSLDKIYEETTTKKVSSILNEFQRNCSSVASTVESFEGKYTNASMEEIASDIYDKCYETGLKIENYVPDNDN